MDDVLDDFRALTARRDKARAELARAEGRLQSANEALSELVAVVKDLGFDSIVELDKEIVIVTERVESLVAKAEESLSA